MKKLMIAASIALLCSGCALKAGNNPKGDVPEKGWTILGSNEKWAFINADKHCPMGYYVLDERPNRPLPPLYLLEIQCKPEGSGQVDLVTRPPVKEPYNPDDIGRTGRYSYEIERMSESKACSSQPFAILQSKGAGIEIYSVDCDDGQLLKVQCQIDGCSVIR